MSCQPESHGLSSLDLVGLEREAMGNLMGETGEGLEGEVGRTI
jgi:hypothetical protein